MELHISATTRSFCYKFHIYLPENTFYLAETCSHSVYQQLYSYDFGTRGEWTLWRILTEITNFVEFKILY